MKIYVDEKPNLCKDCLFYKSKQMVGNMVQQLQGSQYGGDGTIGTISVNYTKECNLLGISVPTEIANVTTLGNCPLEELIMEGI